MCLVSPVLCSPQANNNPNTQTETTPGSAVPAPSDSDVGACNISWAPPPAYSYITGPDCERVLPNKDQQPHEPCLVLNEANIESVCRNASNTNNTSFEFPKMYLNHCPLYQVGNVLSGMTNCSGILYGDGAKSYDECVSCLRDTVLLRMDYAIGNKSRAFEKMLKRYDCKENYNGVTDEEAERKCDECMVSSSWSRDTFLLFFW
jgi:hypothetical protein